jgi:hypothetical protein
MHNPVIDDIKLNKFHVEIYYTEIPNVIKLGHLPS